MKIMALTVLITSFTLYSAFAAQNCSTKVEQGFAFFDNKKSSWIESDKLVIYKCNDGSYEIAVYPANSKYPTGKQSLRKPPPGENWYLDGLSCSEKNKTGNKVLFRNKVILGAGLNVREGWALDLNRKWEKVDAAILSCHQDEP